jgi:hypothetical protein
MDKLTEYGEPVNRVLEVDLDGEDMIVSGWRRHLLAAFVVYVSILPGVRAKPFIEGIKLVMGS